MFYLTTLILFRRVRKILKVTIRLFCLSVRPHETIRLPLNGFSLNLELDYFSEICGERTRLVKICQ
jgi:hypothetical protein